MVIDKIIKKKCPNCNSKMKYITKRKFVSDKKYYIKIYLCNKCGNTYKKVL